MSRNPFDDAPRPGRTPPNPFGEELATVTPAEAADRMERAARKIRGLRSQLGSEGLTIHGMRELIDEVASALEAGARALRGLG
jgi:hypothetical protein